MREIGFLGLLNLISTGQSKKSIFLSIPSTLFGIMAKMIGTKDTNWCYWRIGSANRLGTKTEWIYSSMA
jgi:hypothetical protein